MMRLAANLSSVFSHVPFIERFGAASQAGFDLVELWWPRAEIEAGLLDDDIVAAVQAAGVAVVMLNFDGGHLPGGDRGLAGEPDRVAEFRANVPRALGLAERLGCRRLNALAGREIDGHDREAQLVLLSESVAMAADAAAAQGATVLVEPLNVLETPGYLLPDVQSALDLIARSGRPNVRLQFDVYHIARPGTDPVQAVREAAGAIGHVQVADLPGRHEPGTGTLDFAAVFEALRAAGYQGDIGLEYVPSVPEAPDFGYLDALRALAAGDALAHDS